MFGFNYKIPHMCIKKKIEHLVFRYEYQIVNETDTLNIWIQIKVFDFCRRLLPYGAC